MVRGSESGVRETVVGSAKLSPRLLPAVYIELTELSVTVRDSESGVWETVKPSPAVIQ
jgi:hypothetical protein